MNTFVQHTFRTVLLLCSLLGWHLSQAQSTTLSTAATFSNNNGSGIVTFNFQNDNAYPIIITDIEGVTGSSGTLNASLWYNTTPISGAPGIISTANGWTEAASGTFTGIPNTSSTTLQPILSNISVTIPANTTYGFAVYADGQRYFTMSSAQTFTAGGVTFLMGPNVSYGGGSPNVSAPGNTPRGWIGSITFKPAIYGFNNAGLSQLTSPINFCQGNQQIKVKVQNSGHNMINTLAVHWQLNGIAQTPYTLTTPLDTMGGTGISEIEVLLGTYNFTTAAVPFKAWTTMPNGVSDTVTGNDTLTKTLKSSLSGTYTINSAQPTAGTNYQSFAEFTGDLDLYGICGPVVANVVAGSGPYNEYVVLNQVSGSSATNTIRINGNGATVQYSNTSTERQLLTLSGAKYTRVDSLTFKALSSTYGWGALLTAGCDHDSITHCTFDLTQVTSTSSLNSSGIAISASNSSATSSGNNADNCFIAYNHIQGTTGSGGPYYCVTLYGDNNNNIIRGNSIENFYFYGMYIYNGSNNIVEDNDLNRATKTTVTTFYGIYASSGTAAGLTIRNNRIHAPYGGSSSSSSSFYGIYNFFDGTATDPVMIYNNAIYDINQGGTVYGIYGSTVPYNKYYHNTISIDNNLSSSSTNYGIYLTGTNTGTETKNNLINITAGGTGTKYGFYYSTASSVDDAQKNNIYVNSTQSGTQYYGYFTSAYTTQAAFQAAYPALELGSPAVDPQFTAPLTGDFTPANPTLVGTGYNVFADVPTDINGFPRSTAPTIGAFEVLPTNTNDAAMVSMLNPTGNICATTVPFEVVVRNAGINNITSMQVNWRLNGVLQTPYSYSGTLVPSTASSGQNMDTVVVGTAALISGNNTIEVWTSLPNGVTDVYHNNDSVLTDLSTVAFSVTALSDTICPSGSSVLALTPNSGYPTGSLEWQSSASGTNWSGIPNTDDVQYLVSNIPADMNYRVKVTNNGIVCYSSQQHITVLDVAIQNTTPGYSCGPGQIVLNANPTVAGTQVNWYTASSGGAPIATGNSYTTPTLSSTTDFYAAATSGSSVVNQWIGTGTTTLSIPNPYYNYWWGNKNQYMIRASELLAAGFGPGMIESIAFQVEGANALALTNFEIKMKLTTLTSLSTWESGLTSVYTNASYLPTASSVNVHTLSTPFMWDGASNLIIETCFNNSSWVSGNTVTGGSAGFSASLYYYGDNSTVCTAPGSVTSSTNRPNIQLNMQVGCESSRIPVTATVYTAPTVDLGNDTLICPGTNFSLDAQNAGGSYTWNTGATTQTVSISNPGTYSVEVLANANPCPGGDTIVVVPGTVPTNVLASALDLCEEDVATLDAGNNGSTYQWSTGSTNQTINVNSGGTYSVTITSADGCILTAPGTTVTMRPLPVINLGNDTILCAAPVTLDAANTGSDYLWNTGAGTQTIVATDSGTYYVTVTSPYQCSSIDTIHIAYYSPATVDGFNFIPLFNTQPGMVQFDPINPQYVNSYLWDFGDGNTSTLPNPVHTYAANGNYTVHLSVDGDCGITDTSLMISVDLTTGVKAVDFHKAQIDVFPNPAHQDLTIRNASKEVRMEHISIFNSIGQRVFYTEDIRNQTVQVALQDLSSGAYFIHIQTDKGITYRKFNILK